MDLRFKIYLERAENEIDLAKVIFKVTEDENLQKDIFHLEKTQTFFSGVISHCYYSIFYAAKAYLIKKNIKIEAPEEHKKTYEEFKNFVDSGKLDVELLKIYNEMAIRAEELLGIFKVEKKKRGEFTYQRLSQANKEPANESIKNAIKFVKNINRILGNA